MRPVKSKNMILLQQARDKTAETAAWLKFPFTSCCILLLTVFLFIRCDNFPKDPEKTLQEIRGKKLVVGITENKPWTDLSGHSPRGIEVEILKAVAFELKSEIEWVEGAESTLMEALNARQLHVVIGGISKNTLWADKVGLTNPYLKIKVVVGVPQGTAIPENIRGREVGLTGGPDMARYVRKKGGIPVEIEQPESFSGPVAGYEPQLRQIGLQLSDIHLYEEQKVFAVVRGENAWILYLERFFERHVKEIKGWIVNEKGRRI